MSAVPLCDEVVDSREKAALKDAKEGAGRHETWIVLDKSLTDHRNGPHHHDESQPDTWPEALHHNVAWNFRRNVEREEDGKAIIVLQAMKVEVYL